MGPTVLPSFVGDGSDKLVHATNMIFRDEIDIWVATHKDMAETPRIQAMMRYFIDVFTENKNQFSGRSHIRAAE